MSTVANTASEASLGYLSSLWADVMPVPFDPDVYEVSTQADVSAMIDSLNARPASEAQLEEIQALSVQTGVTIASTRDQGQARRQIAKLRKDVRIAEYAEKKLAAAALLDELFTAAATDVPVF